MTQRNPIRTDPVERYWRRRANRKVRNARQTRSVLRVSLVVAVNVLIAATVFVSVRRATEHFTRSDEFALRQIEIEHTSRVEATALRERLLPFVGRNLLELSLTEVTERAQQEPWVLRASVRRLLPHTIWVAVEERVPAAHALIAGRAYLVDRTGYVIGPSGPGLDDRLPVLTGVERPDEAGLVRALTTGVQLVERLRVVDPRFASIVSEIDLAREDRVAVRLVDGGPALWLDRRRVERNLGPYLQLREEIERRAGSADYVDLRWQGRISVKPAVHTIEEGDR